MRQENENEGTVPTCVGFIMDGNRRWAKAQGLPTLEGHRLGFKKFKEASEWAKDAGVKHVIFYALSTENWNRAQEEVSYLMDLFRLALKEEIYRLQQDNVRMLFIGDLSRFPDDIRESMQKAMEDSKGNTSITITIAASYGGRAEITHATNKLLEEGKTSVSEEEFSEYLWTKETPDPDIIIRTGGECRLSNFLPYQSTYSELFFIPTHWPAFSKEEFTEILEKFSQRERRHGK